MSCETERSGSSTLLFSGSQDYLLDSDLTLHDYDELIVAGGFPEPHRRAGSRRRAWFTNYASTVLERMIQETANIDRMSVMPRLLRLCTARTSGELNVADIARDAGIPYRTVGSYLSHLQAVFLVQLVPAWSRNPTSKVVHRPKVVVADSGLAAHLMGVNADGSTCDGGGDPLQGFQDDQCSEEHQSSWKVAVAGQVLPPSALLSIFHAMSVHSPEAALSRIAKRQAGAFSRAQYLAVGVTIGAARGHLVRREWLRTGATGVYLMASHPWGWRQQYHAALLSNAAGVLASVSAARTYCLPDVPAHPRPVVVVPPDVRRAGALADVRRSSLIRPRSVEGFRVNALPYVMRELAAEVPAALGPLYQSAVLAGQVRFDQVADVAVKASAGRMRGARVLREMLDEVGPTRQPPRSVLERHLDRMLDHPSLPPAIREATAPWAPGREFVDALIDEWRMIVEADGRHWHARLAALDNDRRRDHEALRRGIVTVRFGYVDLRDDINGCRAQLLETAEAFGRISRVS